MRDGYAAHITRESEQVKTLRYTWRDGIHLYLGHLRDRLTLERKLLTESGSVFVKNGDENVHRVRALMNLDIANEGHGILGAKISPRPASTRTTVWPEPGTATWRAT